MKIIITGRPYSGIKDVKEAIESDSTLMAKDTIIIKDTVPEAIDCMNQNPDEAFLLIYLYADDQTRMARFSHDTNPAKNKATLTANDDTFTALETMLEQSKISRDDEATTLPKNLYACDEFITDDPNYSTHHVVQAVTECNLLHESLVSIINGMIAESWGNTKNTDAMAVYLITNNKAFSDFMRIFLIKSKTICNDIYDAMKLWETENSKPNEANADEKPYD